MTILTTRDGTEIYYKVMGEGQPVVLCHGWPLNADMWEYQAQHLADNGFKVVAYDRRGFGRSSQPWDGNDYDTFTEDLDQLIHELHLKDIILVGFSMGGGEVARYIGTHGTKRIAKAVLVAAVPPFLLKTDDNPGGVPKEVFAGFIAGITADRQKFFADFSPAFYGVPKGMEVGQATLDWTFGMAMMAGLKNTLDCVRAFGGTDFREDLDAFDVPTLVIHGDADLIVGIEVSGKQSAERIKGAVYKVYAGAPHGLFITHKDQLNADLLAFCRG